MEKIEVIIDVDKAENDGSNETDSEKYKDYRQLLATDQVSFISSSENIKQILEYTRF